MNGTSIQLRPFQTKIVVVVVVASEEEIAMVSGAMDLAQLLAFISVRTIAGRDVI